MTQLFVAVLHLAVYVAGSSRPGADVAGHLGTTSAGTGSLGITNGPPAPAMPLAITNGSPEPGGTTSLEPSAPLAITNGSPAPGGSPPGGTTGTALVDPSTLSAPHWPPSPASQPDCKDPSHCEEVVKKEEPPPPIQEEPPAPVGQPLGEELAPHLAHLAHLANDRGFNIISEDQKKTYEDIMKKDEGFPTNSTIKKASQREKGKEDSEFGKDGKKQIGLRFPVIDAMLDGLATQMSKARMLAGSEKSVIGVEANLQQFQLKGQTILGDLKGSKKFASTVLEHFNDALSTARSRDNFKESANADSIKELRDQVSSMNFPDKGSEKPPYNKNV